MKNHKEKAEEYLQKMDSQISSIDSYSNGKSEFDRKTILASVYAQAAIAHASMKEEE